MPGSFILLHHAASASRTLRAAEEYITGGVLTEALTAVGDVHLRSAVDHLRQAEHSPRARERVADAAAEIQTAYFAYESAIGRGIPVLRRHVASGRLRSLRGRGADSAATAAVLGWYLGESPPNVRVWLDRTAHQLAESWRDWAARARYSDDVFLYTETMQGFEQYYGLETNVMPVALVRRRSGWHYFRNGEQPAPPEVCKGASVDTRNADFMLPSYERH